MTQPTLPDQTAQKQAAVEVFAQYEPPLYEAYLDMMVEWLAAVKTAMFTGGVATLGLVPDPMAVFSQTPKWHTLTSEYSEQVAREVLAAPYKDLFADDQLFASRPFVRNWIAQRENRLNRVPDEIHGLVKHIIDKGTTNGASIPDVQAQVEQLFADTSMPTWKSRARTVARTEVVGAYNGGLHDAFSMLADADDGTAYVHRWLATEDSRTRPDHVEADGQVQPWGHPFTVGEFKMMHPHDPTGPAKEVINCRCVELMEIKNEPTKMSNRQFKSVSTLKADATRAEVEERLNQQYRQHLTLMQSVCDDGTFCMQTHKPGLCKGQKRGETEPGAQDATKQNPVQVARTAVDGLTRAIQQANAVAASNPKLAAMARRAIAGYKRALAPHQQTLKQAGQANDQAKRAGERDTAEQDNLDARAKAKAQRQKETVAKAAQRIIDRREEKAKLAKMTPHQRTAYHKAKAAKAAADRKAREAKILKEAGR